MPVAAGNAVAARWASWSWNGLLSLFRVRPRFLSARPVTGLGEHLGVSGHYPHDRLGGRFSELPGRQCFAQRTGGRARGCQVSGADCRSAGSRDRRRRTPPHGTLRLCGSAPDSLRRHGRNRHPYAPRGTGGPRWQAAGRMGQNPRSKTVYSVEWGIPQSPRRPCTG